MTQDNKPTESKETENKKPQDNSGVMMTGHTKIFDPETGEVIVDKRNAIHYENMSQALANSLANKSTGFVHEMAFGNGGDRTETTTPENDVCNSYGIDSVWGLGDKIQSSSWLLEKYLNIAE